MTVLIYIHNLKNPWKQDLCVHFYFQSTTTLAASECFRKNILPFTNPSPNFVYNCHWGIVITLQCFNWRGHPLSTYEKLSEKLTFLTPWYAHARVRIRGLEMLVFWNILRTYLMDGPLVFVYISARQSVHYPILRQCSISISPEKVMKQNIFWRFQGA